MPQRQLPLPLSTDEAVMAVWSAWSEDTLQSYVLKTARLTGWLAYHTRFSIKSAAGFPDLVLVREGRLIFAELKRQGLWPTEGRLSKGAVPHYITGQREWLEALAETPAEVYLWWPSDAHDISVILSLDAHPEMECVTRTEAYLREGKPDATRPGEAEGEQPRLRRAKPATPQRKAARVLPDPQARAGRAIKGLATPGGVGLQGGAVRQPVER